MCGGLMSNLSVGQKIGLVILLVVGLVVALGLALQISYHGKTTVTSRSTFAGAGGGSRGG